MLFRSEERVSPPDFDIDFSWDNRDAIYEYLFKKHGTDHVCLLGTHVTYQSKSILRELGKVFGLPKEEIDTLVECRHDITLKRDHIAQKMDSNCVASPRRCASRPTHLPIAPAPLGFQ